jgi:hypothetical protein
MYGNTSQYHCSCGPLWVVACKANPPSVHQPTAMSQPFGDSFHCRSALRLDFPFIYLVVVPQLLLLLLLLINVLLLLVLVIFIISSPLLPHLIMLKPLVM